MAFLAPANLRCLPLTFLGSVDNLTDVVLGVARTDMEIFYIDVSVHDANNTYDAITVTLEIEAEGGGADTIIDAISVGAASGTKALTSVDADGLTEGTVDAGNQFIMTVSNPSTGPDLGITFQIWYLPTDAPNV